MTFCNLGGLSALARVLLVVDVSGSKSPSTPIISSRYVIDESHHRETTFIFK
jgi:hypothetical protein